MTFQMKKTMSWAIAIVVALLLSTAGGTYYLVDYALNNGERADSLMYDSVVADYPELRPWLDSLNVCHALRDTFVTMPSGEKAHALYVKSTRANGKVVVLVHGYKNTSVNMLPIARIYEQRMGYNILLPDLHGHGLSFGNDIRMGWLDRLDILHWIGLTPQMFGTHHNMVRVVVHGVSMGAATTMSVSGEATPTYVKCFVEDCGYTSAWDEFAHELKGRFSLPSFPLLYTASWLTQHRYGWTFKEASPLHAVARCHKPMLFIHGDNDTFVPTAMVYPLYEAKPQPKELWIAPGSKHAMAYKDHRDEYAQRVALFVEKYMH